MICLDTNYLILGLIADSDESRKLISWIQQGEILVTPTLAWYEMMCGPITLAQKDAMRAFLSEILPFDDAQAEVAAHLFNAVGRKRALRVDAMIAAAAIVAGAKLATNNHDDFSEFTASGLQLV